MNKLENFFITHKKPISLMLFIILLGGAFSYSRLKTSLFPEITFPKIKIIADAGLQPVNKMMVTVTKPLENAIKQVPDLHYVRSTTSRGRTATNRTLAGALSPGQSSAPRTPSYAESASGSVRARFTSSLFNAWI